MHIRHTSVQKRYFIKHTIGKLYTFILVDDDFEASDRLKQQQKEAARRENTLVHRLTTKEQELQDYVVCYSHFPISVSKFNGNFLIFYEMFLR